MTPPSSTHTITLPTAETITYTLRSLSSDSDISSWTEFCSSVFSYKDNPPPPSYFARHFYNDPRRDASLVRVLVYTNSAGEEEIVASVRIFRRSLTLGSINSSDGAIEAGGIGEVCTSPSHQRRGLSKILLMNALSIMKDSNNRMSCSLLHASPDFRPVYSKVGGYESVRSNWSVVCIRLHLLSGNTSGPYEVTCSGETVSWNIRRAIFPKDTLALHRLHKLYSEERFITIARSKQFWNEYVSEELGDTLWVLTSETGEEHIIGWMSIRKRGGRYQLREFGMDKSDGFGTAAAVKHLLGVALHQAGEGVGEVESEVSLHLPTIVVSDMQEGGGDRSFVDLENVVEENDDGWMYVNFDENKPNILEITRWDDGKVGHLIWPTDSF